MKKGKLGLFLLLIIIVVMERHIRYQGAIVRDHHILLLSHQEHGSEMVYWAIPGGGIEPGESEEDCVRREMKEETCLDVHIERLLIDEDGLGGGIYRRLKTYLCTIISGDAAPGYEPESEAASLYRIREVRWFDLRQPLTWGPGVMSNVFVYPQLLRIREMLEY